MQTALFPSAAGGLENMTQGELAVLVQELIREDWKGRIDASQPYVFQTDE